MIRAPHDHRFWRKVAYNGPTPTHVPGLTTPCWIWTAHVDKNGYGIFWDCGKNIKAHRLAWMLTHERIIPDGFIVCHHCDNPRCLNPFGHLFLGTHADNSHDRDSKGRGVDHKGEKHPRARLTDDQAREIISLGRSSGRSHSSIAQQFHVARNVVTRIINRKAWKHLEGEGRPPATGDPPKPIQYSIP